LIRTYLNWNRRSLKWIWWLVILGVLATLPVVYERIKTERTAHQVEFVFDYRDLLEISDFKTNPRQFVDNQLEKMKASGIHALAVYESTLNELKLSRRIEVFSSHEAMALTQSPISPNENFTYILFSEKDAQPRLQPIIERGFARLGVKTRPWSYKNQQGLIIEMGVDEASMKPLDPDPITMQMLKEKGFHLVVRLSNRVQPFSAEDMDRLLSSLHDLGVNRIIVDGLEVPGYSSENNKNLLEMGRLLNKYHIGLASIEMLKEPQKGFSTLAKEINYNVVRLHSFTEKDGEKLNGGNDEASLQSLIQAAADRFVLAVTDRNIRMVFLNAKPYKNVDKGIYTDPLNSIYRSLSGPDGALNRIQHAGFTLGPAKPMVVYHAGWQKISKAILFASSVAVVALTIAAFFPQLLLFCFVAGLAGSAGLYVLSSSVYGQLTALAVGICAPTLAIILAIRTAAGGWAGRRAPSVLYSIGLLIRTTLVSLIGVVFIIGLLNNITYFLVLEQYRGVSALHLVPIVLAAAYLLFFHHEASLAERWQKVRRLLLTNINILWVVSAAVIVAGIMYYLSRTGNEGQASSLEKYFRSFLQDTLKVRPRTKEFLIAHPLFVLGGYLAVRYKNALYLILAGVIGQLSIVDTFAHLHTPVIISLIRITYGVIFGAVIGAILIGCWKLVSRGWRKWVPI